MLNEFYTSLKQRQYCHCFKENYCEMRKSIISIGAYVHTQHTRNIHTAHTKADRLCIILPKLNPNQFLLILSLFIPSKVPHNCPTPHIPPSCPTKAPPLSSFQTCPQDRRASMQQSMQDFLSILPANLKMWLLYSTEKNARFGNKSKYDFLGNHHSQNHRAA